MNAIFEKIDWNRVAKPKLTAQAVEVLTNQARPASSSVAISQPINENKIDISKESQEVDNMVTSTIVETQAGSNVAMSAANQMANNNHKEQKNSIRDASVSSKANESSSKRRGRDLSSGMDLLEMDFLLDVVESTASNENTDITMRQLCFNELLRRESLHEIGSAALKVYATNGKTYGKDIQCEGMKELAIRTTRNSK